jgi:hypothetical protein
MVQFVRTAAPEMRDMQAHLDKLHEEAAECAMIACEATDEAKRDLFVRLAQHLTTLAEHVERAIAELPKVLAV